MKLGEDLTIHFGYIST